MITVRLTDGKTFAIPFSCENHIALRHGCRAAFKHLTAVNGERHIKSQHKVNATLREIDTWLKIQISKPNRTTLDISSLHSTAYAWLNRAKRGIFHGTPDPDFYLLPENLQLHVLDSHGRSTVDPAGIKCYWIAAGSYNPHRPGAQVVIWRQAISESAFYLDNHVALNSPILDWERIWDKCQAADNHARDICMLCDWVVEEGLHEELKPKSQSPNRARFYLINGGANGR